MIKRDAAHQAAHQQMHNAQARDGKQGGQLTHPKCQKNDVCWMLPGIDEERNEPCKHADITTMLLMKESQNMHGTVIALHGKCASHLSLNVWTVRTPRKARQHEHATGAHQPEVILQM